MGGGCGRFSVELWISGGHYSTIGTLSHNPPDKPNASLSTVCDTTVCSFTTASPPPGDSVPETETREQEPLPAKETPLPQSEAGPSPMMRADTNSFLPDVLSTAPTKLKNLAVWAWRGLVLICMTCVFAYLETTDMSLLAVCAMAGCSLVSISMYELSGSIGMAVAVAFFVGVCVGVRILTKQIDMMEVFAAKFGEADVTLDLENLQQIEASTGELVPSSHFHPGSLVVIFLPLSLPLSFSPHSSSATHMLPHVFIYSGVLSICRVGGGGGGMVGKGGTHDSDNLQIDARGLPLEVCQFTLRFEF